MFVIAIQEQHLIIAYPDVIWTVPYCVAYVEATKEVASVKNICKKNNIKTISKTWHKKPCEPKESLKTRLFRGRLKKKN
jgi:hypothetical protein